MVPFDQMQRHSVRLLTFSTLYPHRGRPNHGVFVENRLRHLVATEEATSRVIAPVPWFPSESARFGDWSLNAQAGRQECRHGLHVHHPRYVQFPKIGMLAAPLSLFISAHQQLRHLVRGGFEFDVIDAHYIYPDGVAAVALGKKFNKPVVLTARGSDITQFPSYAMPRRMIRWAMAEATALISVSAGLKEAMIQLGAPSEKVTVLRNGVDLELFRPSDPQLARNLWGVPGPVLLSVGHLIDRKRHDVAIRSLLELPGWSLVVVGEGPAGASLRKLVSDLDLSQRVIFAGAQPHSALRNFYSAADLLILASSREGWANVLLESMACGTPVIASNIPGNPEVVTDHAAGEVVAENSPACFAKTIIRFSANRPTRDQTRSYAEQFGWEDTSRGQLDLFRRVMRRQGPVAQSNTRT